MSAIAARLTVAALAFLVAMQAPTVELAQPAEAQASPYAYSFGEPGLPLFYHYENAAYCGCEPTMGVAHNVDDGKTAIYKAMNNEVRLTWDDSVPAGTMPPITWTDVTSPWNDPNVDPIMYTDYDGGRAFSGGLTLVGSTGCSSLSFTDDNGNNWEKMLNPCALPGWDHETIGAGPWADPEPAMATYDRAVYYCAQAGTSGSSNCWQSLDGGVTFSEMLGNPDTALDCSGLHGHIRVSRADGSAYLPYKWCNGYTGFAVTTDNGNSWSIRTVVDPESGSGDFDPSIAPTDDKGWVYIGQTEMNGAFIAMSKDAGLTWENLGGGNGAGGGLGVPYFNVGSLVGVQRAAFAEVITGDDDRAAFAFLGSKDTAPPWGPCGAASHVFQLYVAFTYDAGVTWEVTQVTEDDQPVQKDAIWAGGGSTPCRNLLDFNDIVIDREGRVMVAYTDGCPGDCAPLTNTMDAAVARQTTGRGLYSAFDKPVTPKPAPTPQGSIIPTYEDEDEPPTEDPSGPDDTDLDGVIDPTDNCPMEPNPDQLDNDGDYAGDACDPDADGDGAGNVFDNCPLGFNPGQSDVDEDYGGDVCDPDADDDSVPNASDGCWLVPDPEQLDSDLDGTGDACDEDRDGDGVPDHLDAFPEDPMKSAKQAAPAGSPVSGGPGPAPKPDASGVSVGKAETSGGFPWIYVLAGVAGLVLVGGVLLVVAMRRKS